MYTCTCTYITAANLASHPGSDVTQAADLYKSLDINCQVKRNRKESWNWAIIWKVAVNTLHLRSSLRCLSEPTKFSSLKHFLPNDMLNCHFHIEGWDNIHCVYTFSPFLLLFHPFFLFLLLPWDGPAGNTLRQFKLEHHITHSHAGHYHGKLDKYLPLSYNCLSDTGSVRCHRHVFV